MAFFESQLSAGLASIDSEQAKSDRDHILALLAQPRDPIDEELKVPLFVCRHVLCSESTSWLGFLPPPIRNKNIDAYDPLPPSTAISMYNNAYFAGAPTSSRAGPGTGGAGGLGGGGVGGRAMEMVNDLMGRMTEAMDRYPDSWQERIGAVWREMTAGREFAGLPEQDRDNFLQQVR